MRPFHDLTPIGQARRLRPHAFRILDAFGIRSPTLQQLTAATNTVFRVDTPSGDRFVLRMTSPKSAHSADNVRAETTWIRDLHRNTDIGVAEPMALPDGTFTRALQTEEIPGIWHCALFRWVPGAMLSDRLTPENVARQGTLAARLHQHGSGFEPPSDFHIRTYRTLFPYSDPEFANPEPIMLFDRCTSDLMPPERVSVFRDAHDRIQGEIDRLFGTSTPHVIHNDLHLWNVKIARGRVYALDFEDLLWGHPIQDVATALYYYRHNKRWPELLEAFRSGYERVRPWPGESDGQLESLIAARGILLANFVVASQDAAERAIAPDYLARMEQRLRDFLAGNLKAWMT